MKYSLKYPLKAQMCSYERAIWNSQASEWNALPMTYEWKIGKLMKEVHRHINETFHWTTKHYTHFKPGNCLVFIIKVLTTSPVLRLRFPQKSWSLCSTWTWGMHLPVSIPWPPWIHGFRYIRHPCCQYRLLRLPKRGFTRQKNTTSKAWLVSCDLLKAKYHLYVWLPWYIPWTYSSRKR